MLVREDICALAVAYMPCISNVADALRYHSIPDNVYNYIISNMSFHLYRI